MRRPIIVLILLFLFALGMVFAKASSADAAEKYPVPYDFLGSAVLAGAQVDADPPGANDFSCKPTKAKPRPVVLVHGTAGNKNTNWQTYAPLLANNGYCVYSFTYGVPAGTPEGADQFGGLDAIETSAGQLKSFVAKVRATTGARQVDLVGHSQGTLMPNYWLKFLGGAGQVRNYVSLAPLWNGTGLGVPQQLAAAQKGFGRPFELPGCKACTQMSTGSDFMQKMRAGGVAVPGVRYTNIVTKYDQLVLPYTSGVEPGMTNYVVQDSCSTDYSEHFEIAADPVAAGLVLNALDPARKKPVPCTTVLPFVGPAATYSG